MHEGNAGVVLSNTGVLGSFVSVLHKRVHPEIGTCAGLVRPSVIGDQVAKLSWEALGAPRREHLGDQFSKW